MPEKTYSYYRELAFDVRLESLLAALMGSYSESNLENKIKGKIVLDGHFRRFKATEIQEIDVDPHEGTWMVRANREGLRHRLPDTLFIPPNATSAQIQERQEETKAFFSPFDHVLWEARAAIEQRTLQFYSEPWSEEWEKFWKLPDVAKQLSPSQLQALHQLLPHASEIVGDWELTEECFSVILQRPVHMWAIPAKKHALSDFSPYCDVSHNRLGIDFVLGEEFYDGISRIQIQIPIESKEDPKKMESLVREVLVYYFVPAEIFVDVKVLTTNPQTNPPSDGQ